MTIKQFVDKWLGKKADFDGAYGGQCVDLARFYFRDVLEINQPKSVVGAGDFWGNYDSDPNLKNNFTKISNTADFIPKEGDVMIWNKRAGGGYGHIAIVYGNDHNTTYFHSFDQNWSKVSYCEIVKHTYTNVYGVFRPLKTTQESMTEEEINQMRLDRDKNWNLYQTELENVKKLTSENSGLKEERDSIKKKYNELIEYIFTKTNPLKPLIDQSEDSAKAEIVSLVSNIDILNKEIKDTQNEANDKETKLIKENEVLQGKLDTLQTQFDKLKENHASELEAMQAKIDKVQAQVDANSKTKQENNTIMTWIENIIKKLKG